MPRTHARTYAHDEICRVLSPAEERFPAKASSCKPPQENTVLKGGGEIKRGDKRLISQREGEPGFRTRGLLEARRTFRWR